MLRSLSNSYYDKVDDAVWHWFHSIHAQNTPVSGPMIQEQAREFAKRLQKVDFKATYMYIHNTYIHKYRTHGSLYPVASLQLEHLTSGLTGLCQCNHYPTCYHGHMHECANDKTETTERGTNEWHIKSL